MLRLSHSQCSCLHRQEKCCCYNINSQMLYIGKEILKLIELYHLQDWHYINLQSSLIAAVTCKLPKVFWLGHLTQRGFLAKTQYCRKTFWSFLCVTGQLVSVKYFREKVGSVKVIALPHSRHWTSSGSPKGKYVVEEGHTCFPFNCSSKLVNRQNGLCLDLMKKQLPGKKEDAVIFSSTPTIEYLNKEIKFGQKFLKPTV